MAPAASRLELLHPELVDLVVGELAFAPDISALRLTCRTLATRVAQSPGMRRFLARKTVELTVRELETFVAMTGPGCVVGHQLRHLTLKGIARNKTAVYMSKYSDLPPPSHPDEDPEQDQDTLLRNVPEEDPDDHWRLLTAAFSNLKKYGRHSSLASLALTIGPSTNPRAIYIVPRHKRGAGTFPEEVDAGIGSGGGGGEASGEASGDPDSDDDYVAPYELPYRPSWRSVWDASERTFDVVMDSLTIAQLPVTNELDIYQSVVACALPFDTFLKRMRDPALIPIFSSLKRLKVHMSLRHRTAADERKITAAEEARQDREAENDGVNEGLTISRLQAEFEAAYRAQVAAEQAATLRVLGAITAPTELTRVMPALEFVSVEWYHIGRNMVAPTEKDLALPPPLPPPTDREGTEDTDRRPLKRLQSISLHGSFRPVLRYLTDPDLRSTTNIQEITNLDRRLAGLRPSPIRRFEIDDVMEGTVLVHYDVPGRPKFRYLDRPDLGPSTLVRPDPTIDRTAPMTQAVAAALAAAESESPEAESDTIPEEAPTAAAATSAAVLTETPEDPPGGVQMVLPTTRPMGSGSRWRWARHNGSVYGPPRARYDLPLLNPGMAQNPPPWRRLVGNIQKATEIPKR
ncbi:hypothetical protein Sste5344_007484 [Sporothrix stenoceras]